MNTNQRSFRIKLAAGLTLGISCLLYAAAVFIPSTQPTLLLGQYTLQNNDLLNAGTIAYRPWFENGAWQGEIVEYLIAQDGSRSTDVAVGANPATHGSSGGCNRSASGCWSARASFIDNGADNPTGSYWQTRNIFTYNSAAVTLLNPGGQVDFTWDELDDTQRQQVDPATYNYIVTAADPTLNTATASDILNYVRGAM
jgi:hypothetical protein